MFNLSISIIEERGICSSGNTHTRSVSFVFEAMPNDDQIKAAMEAFLSLKKCEGDK